MPVAGECRGHGDDVLDVAWSPDGSGIVSASVENTVILWDAEKGKRKVRYIAQCLFTQRTACSTSWFYLMLDALIEGRWLIVTRLHPLGIH